MTDKELLTFAAKAAGIFVERSRLYDPLQNDMLVKNSVRNQGQVNGPWNPLTDDGDALRLAVKLGIMVDPHHGIACVRDLDFDFNPNMIDAARRAIVRAAASIGEQTCT